MRPSGYRGIPLQRYLVQLYALSVLPLILVAAWLAYQNVQAAHQEQNRQASQIAHNLATVVDQRLRSAIQALTAIAQSAHLDSEPQWALLYADAQNLKSTQGMDVVILDAEPPFRMRLSTLVPLGAVLPTPPRAKGFQALPVAIATSQPAVGDVVISVFTKRPVVPVAVPAVRQGRVVQAVVSPLDVAQFQRLLDGYALPEGWAIALLDGTGRPLVSKRPAGFESTDDMGSAGRVEVVSSLARWTVELQIPHQARQAALWSTGGALALLVLAATLAGVGAGWIGSRRVGRAVASLTDSASTPSDIGITEIHNARTSLDESAGRERLSEARFRRMFHDAPIGLRLSDAKGQVLAQNATFDSMFGYTIEEASTLSKWRELAYPDPVYRQHVETGWTDVSAGRRPETRGVFSDQFQITAKDGGKHEVQVRGSLLADGLLTSFVDLTELREAEASLSLWAEAFEHSELSLNISDLHSLTFKAVNPAFARLHGYEPSEMVGMPVGKLIPPDQVDRVRTQFEQLDSGVHANLESENLRKDGSRFPVQIDVTILKDSQGTPASRFAYVTDLTERKRTEAEIRALHENLERRVIERTAQLSQANLELDSFAYTVSHDLRAPLRAMDGFLHLLCEEYGDHLPEDAQIHLAKIGAAIVRMKNLIEGILTLTHSARHDLQLTPVNLSELVSKYLNEFGSADLDRKVDFDVQSGLMAVGDARMLDVVVSNLVSNAWKYTAKTAKPSIRFFARELNGQTWFCLADNGAGFDSAYAAKLFEPFQRMHRHEDFPGIGIGLATVRRIVVRHGGNIAAESSPGKGACFRFTLNAGT